MMFGLKTHEQVERQSPACPKCGRRYAERFTKPKEQTSSFRCIGVPTNPGCGNVWRPK